MRGRQARERRAGARAAERVGAGVVAVGGGEAGRRGRGGGDGAGRILCCAEGTGGGWSCAGTEWPFRPAMGSCVPWHGGVAGAERLRVFVQSCESSAQCCGEGVGDGTLSGAGGAGECVVAAGDWAGAGGELGD